jgi:hypothetical protein
MHAGCVHVADKQLKSMLTGDTGSPIGMTAIVRTAAFVCACDESRVACSSTWHRHKRSLSPNKGALDARM